MWQLPLVLPWLLTLMTGAAAVPRSRRRAFLGSARLLPHSLALCVAPQGHLRATVLLQLPDGRAALADDECHLRLTR